MHTTAETALQESQTYTRNNSRGLPPQHKLVYSQYTPQLNSTEQCEPSIPFSLKPCTPKVTEDMLARHVFWDKFTETYFPGGSSYVITARPTGASLTSSANPLTAVGQLKCPTPKKSTAKITTNILRPHIPLMQGQWSQPRLDEWRTNQLATASPWIMDACRARHTSRSAQDDKWASKTQPRKRKHGNFFKIIFTRGPPDTPENMVSPARI